MEQTKTFNPGPSQITEETKADIEEAIQRNILSISHRSKEFSEMSKSLLANLRILLGIPEDYKLYYVSSGTEAMQLIIQNLVDKNSFHFTNGSFSERFLEIAQMLGKKAFSNQKQWGERQHEQDLTVPGEVLDEVELIAVTYNETSTGAMWNSELIKALHELYPSKLLAVDIVSVAGAREMSITDADVWFFSVQKCFGLPAGLGIITLSQRAYERAKTLEVNKKNTAGIFTFSTLEKNMEKYQTIHTPNVLNIFLLEKQVSRFLKKGGIKVIERETKEKQRLIETCIEQHPSFNLYVKNPDVRSSTVIAVEGSKEAVEAVHKRCKEKNIVLGKGYGKLKETTFRVANFPAHTKTDIEELVCILNTTEQNA